MSEELLAIFTAVCFGFAIYSLVGLASGHTVHEFPVCDADAPRHLTIEQKWNEDADEVAESARDNGWTNITVKLPSKKAASISADCEAAFTAEAKGET